MLFNLGVVLLKNRYARYLIPVVLAYSLTQASIEVRYVSKSSVLSRVKPTHTLNLHSRRIACALGRVQELQKIVTHGTQSQNTWKNLRKVIPSLKPEDRASFIKYIDQHISVSSFEFCEHILRQNLIHSQYLDISPGLQRGNKN